MQNFDQLLKAYDLFHKKDDITKACKSSIGLRKLEATEENIPIGTSKLGGLPDLPSSFAFPKYHNGYLSFLAQLNLEEVKPFDKDKLLPEKGILYFFYDVVEQPWGFDKEDTGCFQVLYFDGDVKELIRTSYPEETEDYFPLESFKVEFYSFLTLSEELVNVELDEDESENFYEFRDEFFHFDDSSEEDTTTLHYLLGEPFNIQNNVFEEIVYYEHEEKHEWDSDEVSSKSKEMVLLFQMDSDDDLEVMWGDSGILYFCIEKEDLKNKRFAQTKFILQCY